MEGSAPREFGGPPARGQSPLVSEPDLIIDAEAAIAESQQGSMTWLASRREFFQKRTVGGLRLISSIEGEGLSASAVRMGANPGVFVGESPGLDRCAARIVQTRSDDAAIDVRLARQVNGLRQAVGIQRQGDVKLGDVNLHAQCG